MIIQLKDKETLKIDLFELMCSIGRKGLTKTKREGDKKTPKGTYTLGDLYYRKDRNLKLDTSLKTIPIKKNMGWCDDIKSIHYNKLIKINKNLVNKKIKHEKLYRFDSKYDLLIPINYNNKPVIKNKGSAIFIHLTKNYKPTAGCIALKKNDMLVLLKLLKKNSKIKIT